MDDVLHEIAVSQSALERKFKQHLGRTPKAEIMRIRIENACALLAESELALFEVARRSGFSTEKYFSDAFLREVGVRPNLFRKQRQISS